jgi:hypothetical protein
MSVGALAFSVSGSAPVAALAFLLFQAGSALFLVTAVTYRQLVVPVNLLGRVHALARAVGLLGQPAGAALASLLADRDPALGARLCGLAGIAVLGLVLRMAKGLSTEVPHAQS